MPTLARHRLTNYAASFQMLEFRFEFRRKQCNLKVIRFDFDELLNLELAKEGVEGRALFTYLMDAGFA